MKKAVLFLAIFGLSTGECCYGVQHSSSDVWGLDRSDGVHGKRSLSPEVGRSEKQRFACEYDSSLNLAEKRNAGFAYKLAESLGRVTLGTSAIAGTTFVGICFCDALIKAGSIREQNTLIKVPGFKWNGWYSLFHHPFREMGPLFIQPFKQAFSLFTQMFSSWSDAREIIARGALDWVFVSAGSSILFNTGWSTVWKGYKFGVMQIYKGTYGVWGVER